MRVETFRAPDSRFAGLIFEPVFGAPAGNQVQPGFMFACFKARESDIRVEFCVLSSESFRSLDWMWLSEILNSKPWMRGKT